MKRFWLLLLTICSLPRLPAQGTYPLLAGDVWQYRDSYDSTYGWTHKAVKDTIMPNGLTYIKLIADNAGGYFDGYYRQDSSKVFYYGRYPTSDTTYQDYEELWYDFSKTTGDTVRVTVQHNPPDTITVRVIDDRMMNVFGKMRRTWVFYETSKRTSVYILRQVADSIGLIHLGGEGGIAFSLFGAIINGTKYGTMTRVEDQSQIVPSSHELLQNYPNPFNSSTTIDFTIPKNEYISLTIYNMLGQEIATIAKGNYSSGKHQLHWDAGNLSSGIYFYRLQITNYSEIKKLVLIK
jgi:hypothetical protein